MSREKSTGRLGRSLLHYYIALKLGAAAIAPVGLPAHLDSPPPIVRRHRRDVGEWDPREVVRLGDTVAVITMPANPDTWPDHSPTAVTLN